MPSDLTERLAAKLGQMYGFPERVDSLFTRGVAADAPRLLPLLLSEPELVAGLDLKVKVALLGQLLDQLRDQAGYHYVNVDGHLALVCPDPIREGVTPDEVRLSVLTPRERAELRLGRTHIAQEDFDKAYVDIAKLTPLGQPTPEYNEALRRKWDADREYFAALAEVAALTPEGKDAEA